MFYVDLDAFYVSCELRVRPDLVGRPVVVGPRPRGPHDRGVVLSASYEARRHGVRSAMPVVRAVELLPPEAEWIPAHFDRYLAASRELGELLGRRAGEYRMRSIDEAALERELPDAGAAQAWAVELQGAIREELRLPASLGVSPFEVVAKIASDRAKPAGIVVVPPEGTAGFLAPLSVRAIPGVGPKAEGTLAGMGVRTIDELRHADPGELRRRFGSWADGLRALARGEPREESRERGGPRQRSVDRTLESDVRDPVVLETILDGLGEDLARSLEEEALAYRAVILRLRWADFRQTQAGHRLSSAQRGLEPLRAESHRLLRGLLERERGGADRAVRRLSLAVQEIAASAGRQRRLDGIVPEPTVKAEAAPERERDRR